MSEERIKALEEAVAALKKKVARLEASKENRKLKKVVSLYDLNQSPLAKR